MRSTETLTGIARRWAHGEITDGEARDLKRGLPPGRRIRTSYWGEDGESWTDAEPGNTSSDVYALIHDENDPMTLEQVTRFLSL